MTNDLHYVREDQSEAHDVLLCVGTGNNLDTPNRMRFDTHEFYVKSAAQMAALFPDHPEAIRNTRRIAEMTDLTLPLGQLRIPHFPVPDGFTTETWLRAECQRGLERRYGTVTPELQARLDYELGVILTMGYAGYFLIVADFIAFAREQGIQTTCRGSAPGSIVTYTLGITPVDPILYQLPFERFLNPDRVTMPDIDVDFEDGRREEVIAYVGRKYGQDHVAQIITFGTMLARAAIRDVGRVLGHSYGEVDRIAKAVPNQLGIRLDEAIETSPELRGMVDDDPAVKRITDFARHLEGVARNASTHAAGVVISREPLTELMPLQKATNSDGLMSQYEMHAIEALGLLKFDFLGLSNLTILRQAVDLVRANRGIEIDLDAIPLDDATTFELLASGETTGVFQLESAGMRRYVRDLRPTSVYDLAAMVALYRPGPMDNIPAYIRRKHGQEAVTYLHPLLEPYLEKTYGIFVYQEDIMSAAIALGGFTGPEADTLGYAIRKKKSAVLRAQKEKFVTQAAERGVAPNVIDAVFKAFEPFERYGFNKAHATCYGLIAYQTAYMKANHTVDYMTAVLTAFRSNEEKVAAAVAECRRMGIEVLPPDVHHSQLEFTVEGDAIRFGLLAVKNVGQGAIESIIAARDEGGEFRSLTDFCTRIDLRLANRKVLEALAKVGALERVRASGADPARARRRGRRGPGDPARPDHRPDLAVRPRGGRCGRLRAAAADRHRGPGPRAAALGEGAPRAVPLGAPDGRGRRAGRPLRDRLLERPARRIARRPAGRRRRDRDRRPDGHHQGQGDDGDRHPGGPAGHDRGRRLPAAVRADRWRPGGTARSCSSPAGSITRARRSRCWPTSRSSGTRRRQPARRRSRAQVAAGERGGGGRRIPAARTATATAGHGNGRRPGAFAAAPRPLVAGRAGPAGRRRGRRGERRRAPSRSRTSPRGGAAPTSNPRSVARPSRPSPRPSPSRRTRRPRASPGARTRTTSRRSPTRPARGSSPTRRADAPIDAGPEHDPPRPVRGQAPPPDRVVGAMETFKAVMRDRPGATRVVIHVPASGGGRPSDGAAPRRRLRRRAAGRGPPTARRRPGRPPPRLNVGLEAQPTPASSCEHLRELGRTRQHRRVAAVDLDGLDPEPVARRRALPVRVRRPIIAGSDVGARDARPVQQRARLGDEPVALWSQPRVRPCRDVGRRVVPEQLGRGLGTDGPDVVAEIGELRVAERGRRIDRFGRSLVVRAQACSRRASRPGRSCAGPSTRPRRAEPRARSRSGRPGRVVRPSRSHR